MTTDRDGLISFPCDFPIKVTGLASDDFDALVAGIVRKHAPDLGEGAIVCRYSRQKKYVAVTVNLRARSQKQIDSIYMDLSNHPRVMMAL